MESKNFHFVALGVGRIEQLRSYRTATAQTRFLQHGGQQNNSAEKIQVGGQICNHSSRSDPVDESIRRAYEAGDTEIWKSINEGIEKAEKIMVQELKRHGLKFAKAEKGK